MEKNKGIFDVSLDSLLSTPIEVDAADTNYIQDVIPTRESLNKEPDPKREVVNETAGMIELNTGSEENDEEEEEDNDTGEVKEFQEEPSSQNKSPQISKGKTSSPLTPYAKLLVDEGVLPNLDLKEFGGTAGELKDAMIHEIIGAVDMYKDQLPDRLKALINNYEDGVPFEKLLELDRTEVKFESLTEEELSDNVEVQKQIVSDYLKRSTKFNDKKIQKMVDSMEDSGELEDEAKSSLGELQTIIEQEKDYEKKYMKAQQQQAEDNRRREMAALNEKIRNTKEIIPGIQVNDKIRNNVLASMTQPVGYDQSGRPVNRIVAARMENPVEFEMRLHYLFEITKGFTDFTKLADKGRRDASKAFEEAVGDLDTTGSEGYSIKDKGMGPKGRDFLKGLEKTFNL